MANAAGREIDNAAGREMENVEVDQNDDRRIIEPEWTEPSLHNAWRHPPQNYHGVRVAFRVQGRMFFFRGQVQAAETIRPFDGKHTVFTLPPGIRVQGWSRFGVFAHSRFNANNAQGYSIPHFDPPIPLIFSSDSTRGVALYIGTVPEGAIVCFDGVCVSLDDRAPGWLVANQLATPTLCRSAGETTYVSAMRYINVVG